MDDKPEINDVSDVVWKIRLSCHASRNREEDEASKSLHEIGCILPLHMFSCKEQCFPHGDADVKK